MSKKKQDRLSVLPRLTLTERQLFDLELILVGGFAPLDGFLKKNDYETVVKKMRLSDGTFWPMPIVLDVSKNLPYKEGEKIILCDSYSYPIAYFNIESKYKPNKKLEAKLVYGTQDKNHPGVKYLMENTGDIYLGGEVELIDLPHRQDFIDLRLTPKEVKENLKKRGWKNVAAFQTRNPIHRAHFELMNRTHKREGLNILIHPVVGLTKEGDIDYTTRVKSYKRLHEKYMKNFAMLSLLPLAMRMAGPREALWHALIRKNYGATHFIVGRDHAGPGNDSKGKPYYHHYAARDLAKKHEKDLGIEILPQEEMVYVDEETGFVPVSAIPKGKEAKNISGTRFREMLHNGEKIPSWFSFPEVNEEMERGLKRTEKNGLTIFFTGLSASGKSTIAEALYHRLIEETDRRMTLLDGDVVRNYLSKGLGFSKEDRNTNITRIGYVAGEITKHGGVAICAAIAPYEESRAQNRDRIGEYGTYVEIYISTPLKTCIKRDPKGLYKKAKQGLMKGMTGIDDPYEAPKDPEIVIDTVKELTKKSVEKIVDYLKKNKLI